MAEILDILKIRILVSFLAASPKSCTVMGLSRALREEKHRISRTMISLEEEGLLDRSNQRAPVLTKLGKEKAEMYNERVELALNYFRREGVEADAAKTDAYICALRCSDDLMKMMAANDACHRMKRDLQHLRSFRGDEICKRLPDGCYEFPFVIYREHVKDGKNISMANEGFAHPCTLYVDEQSGMIQLLVQKIEQKSGITGKIMHGKVDKMEYFDSGQFIQAELIGDVMTFPAEALNFVNIGQGAGQMLHGSVLLKMRCSCGIAHMPESTAMFTMQI